MENLQQLQDAIASERQEFQTYKADAQNNPQLPDGTVASVGTIVEP